MVGVSQVVKAPRQTATPSGPSGAGRRPELIVLLSVQAMASMADALVTVSAPAIQTDLHLSGAALQLVASGFVLAYAVVLMTGARLGDYGHRRLFLSGLAVF